MLLSPSWVPRKPASVRFPSHTAERVACDGGDRSAAHLPVSLADSPQGGARGARTRQRGHQHCLAPSAKGPLLALGQAPDRDTGAPRPRTAGQGREGGRGAVPAAVAQGGGGPPGGTGALGTDGAIGRSPEGLQLVPRPRARWVTVLISASKGPTDPSKGNLVGDMCRRW